SNEYAILLNEIKERIRASQYSALKAVNKELIGAYWDIGRMILARQEKFGWGKSIVENLSKDLHNDFPGVIGYSADNLWRMRKFYLKYKGNEKLASLVQEISWTKNIVVMEKCRDDLERQFYILMTKKFGWTKDVLIHQIDNKSYEKYLLNQTNFDKALPAKYKHQAKLAVKDEYSFDFLELGEEHSEHELEISLINNLRKFLIEMGGYFTFIGNQYKIELENEELFIDLLLFHRALKCLVAIELKIGDFKPEYVGKMQFYLSVLDDKTRLKDENPSIGIIICKEKKRTFVEYALKRANAPIGVATYTATTKLPASLRKYLPAPNEIAKSLSILKGIQ
ncbi:MAG: PDDEXK nuclease domain-containing protein, partial [Chitinivibrionales bacterium]